MKWKYVIKFAAFDPDYQLESIAYEIFYLPLERQKVMIDYALESDEAAMEELTWIMELLDTRLYPSGPLASGPLPMLRPMTEDDFDDALTQLQDWGDKYQVWVGP